MEAVEKAVRAALVMEVTQPWHDVVLSVLGKVFQRLPSDSGYEHMVAVPSPVSCHTKKRDFQTSVVLTY